jgi:hypothetical protein
MKSSDNKGARRLIPDTDPMRTRAMFKEQVSQLWI